MTGDAPPPSPWPPPAMTTPRLHTVLAWLTLASLACGNGVDTPPSQAGSSSESSVGHSETGVDVTTPTTGASTTAGIASTTASTGTTSLIPDTPDSYECEPFQQDCPAGEKCVWYIHGGENYWNGTKCEPIMEDPAQQGEPCFVVGDGFSGVDNCDIGLICWEPNEENQGHCAAHCDGSPEAPTCADGFLCYVGRLGFSLCIELCDPLLQDCSLEDEICIGGYSEFYCGKSSGEDIPLHGSCEFITSCATGLACVPSDAALECDQRRFNCCEPYCDTSLPNTCPGQDQTCVPWYVDPDDPPPGLESLGICSLP